MLLADGTSEKRYHIKASTLVQIASNGRTCVAEVLIIDKNLPMLLGSQDAKTLGVLRVGLDACNENVRAVNAKTSPLGKLKDFELHTGIDSKVTSVIQPMYRIPHGLRPHVEKCINELLEQDVIELRAGRY